MRGSRARRRREGQRGIATRRVLAEWSPFTVRYLRVQTRPRRLADRPDILLDKTIHAARCCDMARYDGRATLQRFDTP